MIHTAHQQKRLKQVIAAGVLAPAVVRLVAPGWPFLANMADLLTTITTLIWLKEF